MLCCSSVALSCAAGSSKSCREESRHRAWSSYKGQLLFYKGKASCPCHHGRIWRTELDRHRDVTPQMRTSGRKADSFSRRPHESASFGNGSATLRVRLQHASALAQAQGLRRCWEVAHTTGVCAGGTCVQDTASRPACSSTSCSRIKVRGMRCTGGPTRSALHLL